jgi:hypothetical protein
LYGTGGTEIKLPLRAATKTMRFYATSAPSSVNPPLSSLWGAGYDVPAYQGTFDAQQATVIAPPTVSAVFKPSKTVTFGPSIVYDEDDLFTFPLLEGIIVNHVKVSELVNSPTVVPVCKIVVPLKDLGICPPNAVDTAYAQIVSLTSAISPLASSIVSQSISGLDALFLTPSLSLSAAAVVRIWRPGGSLDGSSGTPVPTPSPVSNIVSGLAQRTSDTFPQIPDVQYSNFSTGAAITTNYSTAPNAGVAFSTDYLVVEIGLKGTGAIPSPRQQLIGVLGAPPYAGQPFGTPNPGTWPDGSPIGGVNFGGTIVAPGFTIQNRGDYGAVLYSTSIGGWETSAGLIVPQPFTHSLTEILRGSVPDASTRWSGDYTITASVRVTIGASGWPLTFAALPAIIC